MTQTKSRVPVVTLQKKDGASSKEFKGTVSKGPAKDSGSRTVSKTVGMPQLAQKGPMSRGKR